MFITVYEETKDGLRSFYLNSSQIIKINVIEGEEFIRIKKKCESIFSVPKFLSVAVTSTQINSIQKNPEYNFQFIEYERYYASMEETLPLFRGGATHDQ